MDQSLWQTPESIDFIYSSYMWIQTILSCGKYCQTMQTGTVSRLWLCGRSWRLKIHFGRNILCFWKSYICSNQLDVQETNSRFAQFNRIWNHLSGHWTEIRWFACSGTMGSNCFCFWSVSLISDRTRRFVEDQEGGQSGSTKRGMESPFLLHIVRRIDEARTKGAKVHFASLMDICHLKNAELETKHQKCKRTRRAPRWYCKRLFRRLCSIHWTRIISITSGRRGISDTLNEKIFRGIYWTRFVCVSNDSSENNGCHCKTTWFCRTSSRAPSWNWKMLQARPKISKS